jgi:hypothetical protein
MQARRVRLPGAFLQGSDHMKKLLAAAAFALAPLAAHAADAPAATAPAARLNLDTPIETIVADAKGKAVLDADLPGLSTHEHYDMFKSMSLKALAAYSPKLTPELLAKVATDLAAVQ